MSKDLQTFVKDFATSMERIAFDGLIHPIHTKGKVKGYLIYNKNWLILVCFFWGRPLEQNPLLWNDEFLINFYCLKFITPKDHLEVLLLENYFLYLLMGLFLEQMVSELLFDFLVVQ